MAKPTATLSVEGTEIRFFTEKEDDFISMTDIAKRFNERTDQVISNWLRTRTTVEFLGAWEMLHNADFNPLNFEGIKSQTGAATFVLTITDWVAQTSAIGIRAKPGRYGGTYAHKDIAFEFLSYLSPAFKLYVIKEFQRLKAVESRQTEGALDWNLKRALTKINYLIHTDAVRERLVPPRIYNTNQEGIVYASEADLLNLALFGVTAKSWREANPDSKGNIRDSATSEQLLVLANLENLNAEFIRQGLPKEMRLQRLNEIAIHQMELLLNVPALKQLEVKNK
ncbi:MAG: KilA-N domain-containing protein [Saprospiraceae bacterium]